MPSKKKKYNARFPPARIKKIMQSDDEVGKVAQAVPVIISRALELFVESLLKKAETITQTRNAKTLTPSHLKQCIMGESRFDFLKDLVATVPDVQGEDDLAETPRSSSANTPFLFPPSSSAQAAAIPQAQASYQPQPEYLPGGGDGFQEQKPSVISPGVPHVHQHQSSYVLNPAGITSNPYIPSAAVTGHTNFPLAHSGGAMPASASYNPNPNGLSDQHAPAEKSLSIANSMNQNLQQN